MCGPSLTGRTPAVHNADVTRLRRPALLLSLPLLAVTACGTQTPGSDAAVRRAHTQGVAPELVYFTRIPGYDLAEQSVGVIGDDGFEAVYVSAEDPRRQITLTADQGRLDASTCPRLPLGTAATADGVHCAQDGGLWYRTAGSRHEYACAKGGVVVRLTADREAADRATLRAAAEHLHAYHPKASPTATLPGHSPLRRGDLPPNGDGAPDNHVGVGG